MKKLLSFFFVLLLLLSACGVAEQPPAPPDGSTFAVHFIDVGQADAALILCNGQAMLIDGGNAEDSNLLYTYLKKQGVTRLDLVIGTHAHEDHIGGIAGALSYAAAGKIYSPVTQYDSKAFSNFVKAAEKQGLSLTVPRVGEQFMLGSAQCRVLAVNTEDDTNNTSIVVRITYGQTSFLFTGDAETPVEQAILEREPDLQSTVLKVGHHGSDSSTSYYWLRQVDPDFAVISVGKDNTYGHPTEEVLSRLRDAGVKTYRTDQQGDIICTSDGKTVTFTTKRNTPVTEQEQLYVLNTNSHKFHLPTCSSVEDISAHNRKDYEGTREALLAQGYSPCGVCKP